MGSRTKGRGTATPRLRPGGRSARVRAAVLRATLEELAEKGYRSLGFEGIASRAGVHKTTIYRHWPTQDALIKEALLAHTGEAAPVPDTGSLRGDLIEFGKAMVENITSPLYEGVIRTLVSEAGKDRALSEMGRDFWQERFEMAREIIRRAIARGELGEGTDPNLLLDVFLGPLYLRLLITREPLDEAFTERVVEFLLDGGTTERPSTSRDSRS